MNLLDAVTLMAPEAMYDKERIKAALSGDDPDMTKEEAVEAMLDLGGYENLED